MADSNDESQEDRTESATAFRREESRKQGIVAQSREVLSVTLFFASGAAMYFVSKNILVEFGQFSALAFNFSAVETLTPKLAQDWLVKCLTAWGVMVGPLFAVVMVAALVASVAQVGFFVTTDPLTPNWDRLNPVKGLKRLFSLDSATEAVKALVKMAVVFFVAWLFVKERALSIGNYYQKTVPELSILLLKDLGRLFFMVAGALGVFAAADYLLQRWRVEKQMRMSKREIKEEYKLREGDPMIKARIRNVQRRIMRRRMMEAVPKADVIITNPTHYAVAIVYDHTAMRAPRVVAKGVDFLALKIRELAKKSGVPIVENKPLARTLYAQIPVGKHITEDLYSAVAQVLSYVYRLKGKTADSTQANA